MSKIAAIQAREILDSRGLPTVECNLWLDSGHLVTTAVSTGRDYSKLPAVTLRDNDPSRMFGLGVKTAVENINQTIAPELIDKDPTQQTETDQLLIDLDGTNKKEHLGANALLAVSQAVLKAGAVSVEMPLYYYLQQKYQLIEGFDIPTCVYSMINGGENGTGNLDLKDFFIIPAGHLDYASSLNIAVTFFQKLEEVLVSKEAIHSVGKVGGFAPNLYTNTDALEILTETSKTTPFTFAQDLFLGINVSASYLFGDNNYRLRDQSDPYSTADLLDYYQSIRTNYQVIYIEDPYDASHWKAWQKLTDTLGETTNIVGNQLLTTNKEQLENAINDQTANAITINPIQAGTVSETIEVIKTAKEADWKTIVSHRSGETNDEFLADLAVGVGSNYVKFGAPNRGERVSKYNRLLEIYQQLMSWADSQ